MDKINFKIIALIAALVSIVTIIVINNPALLAMIIAHGANIKECIESIVILYYVLCFINEFYYKIVSKQKLKKRERIGINKRAKSKSEISDKLKRRSNPDLQHIYRNASCLSYNTVKNTTNKAKQVTIKVVQFHISEPSIPDVFTLILKPSRNI